MASKSAVEKNNRRGRQIKAFLSKRSAWKKKLLTLSAQLSSSGDNSGEITREIVAVMNLLDNTRCASYIRYRNRCQMTGKPRGVLRRFGLCRYAVRKHAGFGFIVGVHRMS